MRYIDGWMDGWMNIHTIWNEQMINLMAISSSSSLIDRPRSENQLNPRTRA